MFKFFRTKRLIQVDIDKKLLKQGQKEGSCYLTVGFPPDMPQDEIEDIKNRLNNIVEDIRKYL